MTAPVNKNTAAVGKVALDAPIFDPAAFRLGDEQAAIIARNPSKRPFRGP